MIGRVQSVLKVSCALVLPRASLASQCLSTLASHRSHHRSVLASHHRDPSPTTECVLLCTPTAHSHHRPTTPTAAPTTECTRALVHSVVGKTASHHSH